MIFFFKKSEIHLDAFTSRRDVIEYAPVVNAMQVIPDWWKALPKQNKVDFYPTPTMKTCPGIYEYYKKAIAIPLWTEMCVDVASEGMYKWQFSDRVTTADVHPAVQYTGFTDLNKYGHLKIHSPWLFKTKLDVDWVLTSPIYNLRTFENYFVAPGILNFKRQHPTHLQLFLNVSKPSNYTLDFGVPFLLTPLSDKKVIIHRHLVSHESYESLHKLTSSITFVSKYRSQQKVIKCPYTDNSK